MSDLDPGEVIWRYMPFERFKSLIRFRALWFSKLQTFIDREIDPDEGTTPNIARDELKRQHHAMEDWFPDEERKQQVRQFVDDNERSGRELIVANCWFRAAQESQKMWDEFASGDEGVVVKSTVGALSKSLVISHKSYWIGKVTYIDTSSYAGMDAYTGSQAHVRAFIKNNKFSHENELRVVTMNWVCTGCLNPDGKPPNERQRAGYVYSPDREAIYVRVNLTTLLTEVRCSPNSGQERRKEIELLLKEAGCTIPVRLSELSIRDA